MANFTFLLPDAAHPALETTAAYQLVAALNKSEPGEAQLIYLQQYSATHKPSLSELGFDSINELAGEFEARMLGRYAVIRFSSSMQGELLAFITVRAHAPRTQE